MDDPAGPVRSAFDQSIQVESSEPPPQTSDGVGPSDPPPNPPEDDPVGKCSEYDRNDIGNGRRLIEYFGSDIHSVPDVGWFRYDGTRWALDTKGLKTRELAHNVVPKIKEEADFLSLEQWQFDLINKSKSEVNELESLKAKTRGDLTEEEVAKLHEMQRRALTAASYNKVLAGMKKAHRDFARSSGNSSKIRAMMEEASVYLGKTIEDFDTEPLALNCENATLKFTHFPAGEEPGEDAAASLEVCEHDRADMITKRISAAYDPDAKCPVFDAFMKTVQPDPSIRDFLARWHGYGLLGHSDEQRLAFYYGEGANGKSTLTNLIENLMADYGASIPIEALVGSDERRSDAATPDLVRLPGARYVNASEPKDGVQLKEDMVKKLTGGDLMRARYLHGEFFEFQPQFTLTLSGNHKPEIKGGGHAIWRRLLLVPFDVIIPAKDRDKDLPRKLWEERSGILNWLINGALDYLEGGLQVPDAITLATDEYKSDSDPIQVFIDTCCDVTGVAEDRIKATRMNDAFNYYLTEGGETEWRSRTIANRFKAKSKSPHGPSAAKFSHGRDNATTLYRGIRLKADFKHAFDLAKPT